MKVDLVCQRHIIVRNPASLVLGTSNSHSRVRPARLVMIALVSISKFSNKTR